MKKAIRRGFTLVEMMAVVVIIGILAAVIAPKFFGQVGKAQITAAKQDIENLKKAVTFYKFDTNQFPQELRDLVKEPDEVRNWKGPYLERLPRDPWENHYQYIAPGNEDREFDIWSFGEDDKEGGEKMAADITSWVDED